MTIDQSLEGLNAYCLKLDGDPIVDGLVGIIGEALDNPALPMFARVAACMSLVAGSAVGLHQVLGEGAKLEQMHRADLVPEIATALRAAAEVYESIARGGN